MSVLRVCFDAKWRFARLFPQTREPPLGGECQSTINVCFHTLYGTKAPLVRTILVRHERAAYIPNRLREPYLLTGRFGTTVHFLHAASGTHAPKKHHTITQKASCRRSREWGWVGGYERPQRHKAKRSKAKRTNERTNERLTMIEWLAGRLAVRRTDGRDGTASEDSQ